MSVAAADGPTWELRAFNPRRFNRGAPAAWIMTDNGLLWMTRADVMNNIKDFGDHPELQKALTCYQTPSREFRLIREST